MTADAPNRKGDPRRASPAERALARLHARADRIQIGAGAIAIEPSPGDAGRVKIRVGRRVAATARVELVREAGICDGDAWDASLPSRLAPVVEADAAIADAERRLARRPVATRRLRESLRRAGYSSPAIDRAVAHCEQRRLLDDAAYARLLAEELLRRKPMGARLIEAKLRARGVQGPLARSAAAEAASQRDDADDALALARKRLASMPPDLEPNKVQRRLFGYLARRGFDSQVCAAAVRIALDQRSGTWSQTCESE